MFASFFSRRLARPTNDALISKRVHPRRAGDRCVSLVGGTPYPVENWSMGGLLIHADGRNFTVGSETDVTMKFRLPDRMVDVPHKAHVVRKSKDKVALQFLPLNKQTRQNLQNVIGEFATGQFADSQMG